MVYTNSNRFIVANARNILESHSFKIFVKNEYASSAIGEVSPFDSWVELWVVNDRDYDRACRALENALSEKTAAPWVCRKCSEENDESFEFCWSCGTEYA
jgi:Putative prokaryotic signal transducing protein